nr:hypothetical protein CFP56_19107 [Quercus suber]
MVVRYGQYCPLWPRVLYFSLIIRLTWKCIFRLLFSSSNINVAEKPRNPPRSPFKGIDSLLVNIGFKVLSWDLEQQNNLKLSWPTLKTNINTHLMLHIQPFGIRILPSSSTQLSPLISLILTRTQILMQLRAVTKQTASLKDPYKILTAIPQEASSGLSSHMSLPEKDK